MNLEELSNSLNLKNRNTEEKGRPKISDKVRFWEEQDKINQALIPRVLNMHELIKSSSLLAQKNSTLYLTVSSSVKELQNKTTDFIAKTNFNISELKREGEFLKYENIHLHKLLDDQIEDIKEKSKTHQSLLDEFNNSIENLNLSLFTLKNQIETAEKSRSEFQNTVDTKLISITEKFNFNQSQLQEAENNLERIKSTLKSIEIEFAQVKKDNTNSLTSLNEQIDSAKQDNLELKAILNSNLKSINDLITAHQEELNDLKNKLSKFNESGQKKINTFSLIAFIISIIALIAAFSL